MRMKVTHRAEGMLQKNILRIVLLLLLLVLHPIVLLSEEPLAIAGKVADKLIRESRFSFDSVPQTDVLGLQIIDFKMVFGEMAGGSAYAQSYVQSNVDTSFYLGFSSPNAVKIWLNDSLIFYQQQRRFVPPKEIAYNRFVFQDTIRCRIQRGDHRLLIKSTADRGPWIVFLRAITPAGDENKTVHFSLQPIAPDVKSCKWLCIGPFPVEDAEAILPPELENKPYYFDRQRFYAWTTPRQNWLLKCHIDAGNSYQKESYLEWHYANGATMLALLSLAETSGEKKYFDFVKKYCDFIIDHIPYFEWQYRVLHAYRGGYHRLFRRTMLDDTSAPALPFVEVFAATKEERYRQVFKPIADYILNEQMRLPDGTFCRPEPEAYTVWADDLFMSVPFLLRMGSFSGESKYFDEAAQQILRFYALLFNEDKKLFHHGWFSSTRQPTPVFWGRANGWVLWAMAEALLRLPKNHPLYQAIRERFRLHVEGLVTIQDGSGMWHQVLDQPQSYEETSCTAMFVLALARGVRNGWIEPKYHAYAVRGWEALRRGIDNDGTVHGICGGTELGTTLDFYFERPTFAHDPRGLGAVIIAGVEISQLLKMRGW